MPWQDLVHATRDTATPPRFQAHGCLSIYCGDEWGRDRIRQIIQDRRPRRRLRIFGKTSFIHQPEASTLALESQYKGFDFGGAAESLHRLQEQTALADIRAFVQEYSIGDIDQLSFTGRGALCDANRKTLFLLFLAATSTLKPGTKKVELYKGLKHK